MRLAASLLLALPALAIAQQQFPFLAPVQGWLEKVKSFLPSAATIPTTATTNKAAKAAAALSITPLTLENWRSVLAPSTTSSAGSGPETWMVLVSGGNKTCQGRCTALDTEWNKTAALLATDPTSPKLGYINCDASPVLCGVWYANPPSLWYIQLPIAADDQSRAATTVRVLPLNATSTSARELARVHSRKTYAAVEPYEGVFHPFDGLLARFGLALPIGYVLYGVSLVPSWVFMIGVSFLSRNIM